MLHRFPMRRVAGITVLYKVVEIELPDDLNQHDVERLYRWLRTLPIDDPKPLQTPFMDLIESNSRNAGLACGLEMIAADLGIELQDLGVPDNVHDLTVAARPRRELQGVGSVLIEHAVRRSIALGYGGRIGLHSLEDPETHRYYRDTIEMTELGRDADAENQLYFEYSEPDALEFLSAQTARGKKTKK